ncbi:MAG TPA: chorismate mutase [Verrucomicrobiae bacterium]|nr:chorismate mutase [Verrucomicrobiae bacterium]
MAVRGIRGATTVEADRADLIAQATEELLRSLVEANAVAPEQVAAAWFTTTSDLHAEFPAVAARRMGWVDVPLLCGHEMAVSAENERALPRCIRILLLVNSDRPASAMQHRYLRGAVAIRRDLDRHRESLVG